MRLATARGVSLPAALGLVHGGWVHPRRVRVLADLLAPMIPADARVLDVGCGDGLLARALLERRPDIRLQGVDLLVRPGAAIPVSAFDGRSLPFADRAFDVVMAVDVLHHADSPEALLAELARVGRRVLLKDHLRDGVLAEPTLRLMDRVGNARHGVALPFHYLSRNEWQRAFSALGLQVERWVSKVPIYAPPASWIFGRGLHFVALIGHAACGGGLDNDVDRCRPHS